MKLASIKAAVATAILLLLAGAMPAQAEEQVYGWQLMNNQERMEYRQKMRTLSPDERAAYRKEHHERMQERAKERGVTLPEQPRSGMGRQQGQGRGMGMGGGQGSGRGMGSGGGMQQGGQGMGGQGMGGNRGR